MDLAPDLTSILVNVGPENYAHATARFFAKGGPYNKPKTRQRYALT